MRWLRRVRFRRTTLLTVWYMAFLGGVGLARAGYSVPAVYIWLAGMLLMMFRKRTVVTLLLVIVLGLGIGLGRGGFFMQKLALYENYYDKKVTLTAQAMTDATYGRNGQLSFDANHIVMEDGAELTGKIQLSGFGLNGVFQGDEVQLSGKLRPGFSAYQGRMTYAQMSLVAHHPSLVAETRRRFAAGMQSSLPEPLAPFAMGLLIGQRATLPEENKQELMMVGLTHIIAVSGYNLTIILHASKKVFGRASKRLATFLALALIGVFLLMTGASASIVRAAIVSVLSIAAAYYGRSFKALNLLMLAAVITVWANPVYIWSDISWYLSFLAFYGVMAVAPAVSERVRPGRDLPLIPAVALESLAAEAMTLPYVLHTFGQMSFVGLPANVLVVTLIPLAMLLGLIAGLAGMFLAPLAGWLAWPAKLLLTYMLDVAHLLSHVPGIFVENIEFGLWQMLLCYAIVIAVSSSLRFKIKTKNGKITEKKLTKPQGIRFERTQQMVND